MVQARQSDEQYRIADPLKLNCPFNRGQILDHYCEGASCALWAVVSAEYGNGVWRGCCLKALAKQAVGARLS